MQLPVAAWADASGSKIVDKITKPAPFNVILRLRYRGKDMLRVEFGRTSQPKGGIRFIAAQSMDWMSKGEQSLARRLM